MVIQDKAIKCSNIYCQGYEDKLADCFHHTLQFSVGRTYQSEVAGVDCHGKSHMNFINSRLKQCHFVVFSNGVSVKYHFIHK